MFLTKFIAIIDFGKLDFKSIFCPPLRYHVNFFKDLPIFVFRLVSILLYY